MSWLDFRSDTVTHPTLSMRKAFAEAPVGDDVVGEDPTINELEAEAASLLGKEAALFVPSGTMGNQLAILSQTQSGDEIVLGENCHIIQHEAGATALLSRVQTRTVSHHSPHLLPADVKRVIRTSEDIHYPTTSLICVEQATGCGTLTPLDVLRDIKKLAAEIGAHVHMDGARFFNACHASKTDPATMASYVDTVMVCLSKGLAAPVGSLLVGDKQTIHSARNFRKMLGGGMRQAGILAAAGLVALREERPRLKEDHAKARRLRERLSTIPSIEFAFPTEINMVFIDIRRHSCSGDDVVAALENAQIKSYPDEGGVLRYVCHREHTMEDVDRLADALTPILSH